MTKNVFFWNFWAVKNSIYSVQMHLLGVTSSRTEKNILVKFEKKNNLGKPWMRFFRKKKFNFEATFMKSEKILEIDSKNYNLTFLRFWSDYCCVFNATISAFFNATFFAFFNDEHHRFCVFNATNFCVATYKFFNYLNIGSITNGKLNTPSNYLLTCSIVLSCPKCPYEAFKTDRPRNPYIRGKV